MVPVRRVPQDVHTHAVVVPGLAGEHLRVPAPLIRQDRQSAGLEDPMQLSNPSQRLIGQVGRRPRVAGTRSKDSSSNGNRGATSLRTMRSGGHSAPSIQFTLRWSRLPRPRTRSSPPLRGSDEAFAQHRIRSPTLACPRRSSSLAAVPGGARKLCSVTQALVLLLRLVSTLQRKGPRRQSEGRVRPRHAGGPHRFNATVRPGSRQAASSVA